MGYRTIGASVCTRSLDHAATDERLPDDLVAYLVRRYGECQLEAYRKLAEARGVPVVAVLRAAVDGRLSEIVRR